MTAPFARSFEHWCADVSMHLMAYAGRCLADLPDLDRRLRCWHGVGVPARIVASALTTICPPRATLSRFYTDDRALREWARVREEKVV